jgi:hypothetical protein
MQRGGRRPSATAPHDGVMAWGRGCTAVALPWDGFPICLARQEEQERCLCLNSLTGQPLV